MTLALVPAAPRCITDIEVDRAMKRCQVGCGGRGALDNAHDLLAECYGLLGALRAERNSLRLGLCLNCEPGNCRYPDCSLGRQGVVRRPFFHIEGAREEVP
jgi:hypothetical protein